MRDLRGENFYSGKSDNLEINGYLCVVQKRGFMLAIVNRLLAPFTVLGRYVQFLGSVFERPTSWRMFWRQLVNEIWSMGVNSLWIVSIISFFIGAVIAIEMTINFSHPLLPTYVIGVATRDILLLEFSSTMIALVLAGKIGGSIASEIGSMRITEQIDALDVMGVNSISFLVLPKMLAGMLFFPVLTLLSFIVGVYGGGIAGVLTDAVSLEDYKEGLQMFFNPYYMRYTCGKMASFGFVITTVPSFWGYYVKGGSLEVGRASTRGVVDSCIGLLVLNLLITQLFLA